MPITTALLSTTIATADIGRLVNTIHSVTDHLTPTHPVDVADCITIRDLVAARLPAGYRVEVYHRIREVIVEARLADGVLIFSQEMPVTGVPAASIVGALSRLAGHA